MKRGVMVSLLLIGLLVSVIFLPTGTPSVLASDQPKLKLRMQTHLIPSQMKRTMGTFTEDVARLSKGNIEINLFPVNAIVPQKELMDAVSKGAIDMALYPEGAWFNVVPVSVIGAGIPFTIKSLDDAREFMFKWGFLDILREGYSKKNIYTIPFEPYPVGLMTKRPIRKVEDIKGMKLRAYGTMADMLGKLGASTTQIPGGELYTALSTGVVEGAHWGDAGPMYEMKFHEVLKYYMKPEPIQGAWNCIMINMDLWKRMTPEQKATLEKVIESSGDAAFKTSRELTKKALEEMQQKWGVEVVTLPEGEVAKLRKVGNEILDDIAKRDPLCNKAVAKLRDFLKSR